LNAELNADLEAGRPGLKAGGFGELKATPG
jgi:hypothetical protein